MPEFFNITAVLLVFNAHVSSLNSHFRFDYATNSLNKVSFIEFVVKLICIPLDIIIFL